jgi:hypothetical protein
MAVVDITNGVGRIKIPEPLVLSINTRDRGWFKIKELVVDQNVITGRITLNFLNKKDLRIDRRSGLLTLDGRNDSFSGQCEATEHDAPRKF